MSLVVRVVTIQAPELRHNNTMPLMIETIIQITKSDGIFFSSGLTVNNDDK